MAMTLKAITTRLGYEQITGLSAVKTLTVPTKDVNGLACKPSIAIITPESTGVRWRDDGTSPSAAVGMPLAAGVTLQYDGDLTKIEFIEQSASSKLNVTYYA
jgi:hypothetical protein